MEPTSVKLLPIFILTVIFGISLLCSISHIQYRDAEALAKSNAGNSSYGTIRETRATIVEAGGGNNSLSFTQFSPKVVEINVGDNVTWHNPTKVPVPHTVTFVRDSNSSVTDIIIPFAISKSTQFIPIPPDANSEPLLTTDKNQSNVVTAVNTRAINPTVIDSLGDITYLGPNASYVMDGTEKYLNSGAIFPEGKTRPVFMSISSFTVSFERQGNYNYFCIFHPWMKGTVVVK